MKTQYLQQYENQVTILGNWMNKGPTMSRPKFSDGSGKVPSIDESYVRFRKCQHI